MPDVSNWACVSVSPFSISIPVALVIVRAEPLCTATPDSDTCVCKFPPVVKFAVCTLLISSANATVRLPLTLVTTKFLPAATTAVFANVSSLSVIALATATS